MEKIKKILFNNLNQKQIIFKNTFWLALAEGVTKISKLFLFIYIARILGVTEYGKFTFALAFVGLFAIFSDLGLSSITTREFAREQEKEKEFASILSLKILLNLGTLVLILVGSFFITPDPVVRKIIWILAIYTIIGSLSGIIYAFFHARQQMEYRSWSQILQALAIVGAGFFILFKSPSVENLSYSYLFASAVALIFILVFFHLKVFPLKLSWQKSIWQKFLKMSWPLALAGVFGTIYSYIDSVIMGYSGQITQTGWYNAASKIASAASIPMVLIAESFFPALSLAFKESKEKLQKIWNYQMEIMILLAIPIVIGGLVLAPKIIDLVYDPSYFPSIAAFQILIFMTGLVFLSNPFKQVLFATNHQKKLLWIALWGAMVNLISNIILIPRYSFYGAAIATVITYIILLLLFLDFTRRFTPINPINFKLISTLIGVCLSALAMYFVISHPWIYNLNILFSISIGAGTYLVCFFIYKKVSKLNLRS